ncbi:hypothetical protein ACOSQ4_010366 [Xanthoceras sorbifolium]
MATSRGSTSNTTAADSNISTTAQVQASSFPNHLNFNLPLKLDQDNYVLRKSQVLPAIKAFDLEEFILGESICPEKYVTTSCDSGKITKSVSREYLQWKKTDQLLICWIKSIISAFVVGQVTQCSTACEIWSVLEKLFSQYSLAKILQIRSQIQSIKKGSLTISEYVLKMRGLVDSLSAAGQPMSDRDLLLNVLQGVGIEYDAVEVNLSSALGTITLQDA